jgi:hypothetical protein
VAAGNPAFKVTQQGLLNFPDIGSALLQILRVGGLELFHIEIQLCLDRFFSTTAFFFDAVHKLCLKGFIGQHQTMGFEYFRVLQPQLCFCMTGQHRALTRKPP